MSTASEPTTLEQLVDAIAADPAQGRLTIAVDGRTREGLHCEARARDHRVDFDEPAELAGTDLGPNPVEMVLAAFGACQAITYRVWAARLGLRLDDVRFELEGDIDLAGFLGVRDDVRPGPTAVRERIVLVGPEPRERYEELARVVDRHCPVLDLVANREPVTVDVVVESPPGA
ncbi:OsmC family protein [Miltoncostaea marina]|uniref:OsmC family protein n=1 Tax=Miltoncostaea marina TaxID=2843215 RepID=UPI001C3D7541|nr:OsmC family protein [Miltoncostaea marina]